MSDGEATAAVTWLLDKVVATIADDDPPPPIA